MCSLFSFFCYFWLIFFPQLVPLLGNTLSASTFSGNLLFKRDCWSDLLPSASDFQKKVLLLIIWFLLQPWPTAVKVNPAMQCSGLATHRLQICMAYSHQNWFLGESHTSWSGDFFWFSGLSPPPCPYTYRSKQSSSCTLTVNDASQPYFFVNHSPCDSGWKNSSHVCTADSCTLKVWKWTGRAVTIKRCKHSSRRLVSRGAKLCKVVLNP